MCVLVLVNLASLAYLFWVSSVTSDSFQLSAFESFAALVVLDVLFVETATVYTFHVLFIRFIAQELATTKDKVIGFIMSALEDLQRSPVADEVGKLPSSHEAKRESSLLDVSRVFNVSAKVARFVGGFERSIVSKNVMSLNDIMMNDVLHERPIRSRAVYYLCKLPVLIQDIIVKLAFVIVLGGSAVLLFTLKGVLHGWLSVASAGFILLLFIFGMFSSAMKCICKRNYIVPMDSNTAEVSEVVPGIDLTARIFRSQYYVEAPNTFLLRSEYHIVSTAEELITGVEGSEGMHGLIDNPNINFDFSGISREEIELALGSFPNSPRGDENESFSNPSFRRTNTASLERLDSREASEVSDNYSYFVDRTDENSGGFEFNENFYGRRALSSSRLDDEGSEVDDRISYEQAMGRRNLQVTTSMRDEEYVSYSPNHADTTDGAAIDIGPTPRESPHSDADLADDYIDHYHGFEGQEEIHFDPSLFE
jgi:hypothetical protein